MLCAKLIRHPCSLNYDTSCCRHRRSGRLAAAAFVLYGGGCSWLSLPGIAAWGWSGEWQTSAGLNSPEWTQIRIRLSCQSYGCCSSDDFCNLEWDVKAINEVLIVY